MIVVPKIVRVDVQVFAVGGGGGGGGGGANAGGGNTATATANGLVYDAVAAAQFGISLRQAPRS